MQAADDMEFGDRFRVPGCRGLEGFFQRHGVSAGSVFLAAKSTKTAGRNTDIRRVDMAINVEVGLVSVQALADVIREPADREDVPGLIKTERVVFCEALSGQHFTSYRFKPRVIGLKWVQVRHYFDDTADKPAKSQKLDVRGALPKEEKTSHGLHGFPLIYLRKRTIRGDPWNPWRFSTLRLVASGRTHRKVVCLKVNTRRLLRVVHRTFLGRGLLGRIPACRLHRSGDGDHITLLYM